MIVGKLLRLAGHGEHDDASYIPDTARQGASARDCLAVCRARVLDEGWMTEDEVQELHAEARRKVDQAVAKVSKEPLPDPFKENWQALSSTELVEGQHEA